MERIVALSECTVQVEWCPLSASLGTLALHSLVSQALIAALVRPLLMVPVLYLWENMQLRRTALVGFALRDTTVVQSLVM